MGIILENRTFEVTRVISPLRQALSFCYMKNYNFPLWGELSLRVITAEDTPAKFRFSISLGLLQVSFFSFSLYFLPCCPFVFRASDLNKKPKAALTQDLFVFLSFWLETRTDQIKWMISLWGSKCFVDLTLFSQRMACAVISFIWRQWDQNRGSLTFILSTKPMFPIPWSACWIHLGFEIQNSLESEPQTFMKTLCSNMCWKYMWLFKTKPPLINIEGIKCPFGGEQNFMAEKHGPFCKTQFCVGFRSAGLSRSPKQINNDKFLNEFDWLLILLLVVFVLVGVFLGFFWHGYKWRISSLETAAKAVKAPLFPALWGVQRIVLTSFS